MRSITSIMLGLPPVQDRQTVKQSTVDRVFEAFRDGEPKTTVQVAKVAGYTPAVAHNTLTRMKRAGVVTNSGYIAGNRGPVTLWTWAN